MSDTATGTGAAPRRSGVATSLYITLVLCVGVGLTVSAVAVDGLRLDTTLAVMCLLAVATWWSGPTMVGGRVLLSFSSIVMLAAIALLGPAGAGVVGLVMGPLQRGSWPLRARLFNTGMSATLGVLGSVAYLSAGGLRDSSELIGASAILRHVGWPILVADLVHLVLNLALLAGVVRLAQGVPIRSQVASLLPTTGPAYLGYGAIAFLMVVLWEPAGLGPASVLLVLPPLLVARWAYAQYAEEAKGHERALQVLVAAVETKAPHLVGHSARVAELSGRMAERLGLRGQVVADTRVAGMLHDLGLTTLPTALVRGSGPGDGVGLRSYPARGGELLQGLSFLAGSLDAISHHRDAVALPSRPGADELALPARIVGLADEYDLLTVVGTPDGEVLDADEALARLRTTPAGRGDVLAALEHAVSRRSAGASA
ncbi:MAG TPA: HD domain-containing phosphohydrolase [Ornithinibacter sp.]|nr:HD domain-containing phosphohydrolase [Ornithinibacter sp.]